MRKTQTLIFTSRTDMLRRKGPLKSDTRAVAVGLMTGVKLIAALSLSLPATCNPEGTLTSCATETLTLLKTPSIELLCGTTFRLQARCGSQELQLAARWTSV